jgi:hypothetical protein
MMPPHVTDVDFDGTRFTLTGYTLDLPGLEDELTLVDADTNEPIPYSYDVDCEREERGSGPPMPGSVQYRCELIVRPTEVAEGQRVRLTFLDVDETVTSPASPPLS